MVCLGMEAGALGSAVSSRAICGSPGAPVKSDVSVIGVSGRT